MIEIGSIVKWEGDPDSTVRYIVIANSQQELSLNYINSFTGRFNIENIKEMAKKKVYVTNGFDYKIMKMLGKHSTNNNVQLDEKFIDALHSEISI